jgi:ParB family chromosome partitioning protein
VPAIVRTLKEIEQLEIALIENVQRVDLSPLEQAASIERLHGQFNVSYNDIAKRLGKAPSTINNIVRLIQLPIDAQNALRDHAITEGHARMILSLKDSPDKQEHLLNAIIKDGWSVRMAERYVTSLKEGAKTEAAAKARVSTETPATKQLAKRLGAPVHLRRTAKGGKLEIGFKDDADLERITKLFATE